MIRGRCRNGSFRRAVLLVLAAVSLALVGGCGSEGGGEGKGDDGPGVVDSLLGRGVGEFAEGRWECDTETNDGGFPRRVKSVVNIAADGRFSYDELADRRGYLPLHSGSGTWSVSGRRLRLSIPWEGDGDNGFDTWSYDANADPPTHLEGTQLDIGPRKRPDHELDVEIGKDRIRLVQEDQPGGDGPNYDWDVTCTRESSEPGEIPPTVPPSDGDDDEVVVPEGPAPAATTAPGGS